MLKSVRSTLPSLFRSAFCAAGVVSARLYQYASMEKSTKLTRPSPLISVLITFGVKLARIVFVPTLNPAVLENEVISPSLAAVALALWSP